MNTDILHHSFLLGFAPVSHMLFSLAVVVMIVIILLSYFCLFQILNSWILPFPDSLSHPKWMSLRGSKQLNGL